jgi:hypothetical protein
MKPKPTHYSRVEGGDRIPWTEFLTFSSRGNVHTIWFDDGSVFDMVNGWRGPTFSQYSIHKVEELLADLREFEANT